MVPPFAVERRMTDKPPIPDVADVVAVARWFIEYDDRLKYFRSRFAGHEEWLVDEIRLDVQTHSDVVSLKRYVRMISNYWSTYLLPPDSSFRRLGVRLSAIEQLEPWYEAKVEILRYILHKKSGVSVDE